jgi:23S rRNA pseudouridine1911/1915/1917 synthase
VPEEVRTFTADRGDAGRRLDHMLRRHLTDLRAASRTRVQRWIADGRVSVNGVRAARASARIASGDLVSVTVPDVHRPLVITPEPRTLQIVYEDEHLVVVDKPAGVVVHPTYRNYDRTIMNALAWHARKWRSGQRPSLVGRLDKMTSGLLLVAKTGAVHRALQHAGHVGALDKDYLAIVYGRVTHEISIDLPIAPDPRDRRRYVACASGVRSSTRVYPLANCAAAGVELSLLRCRLVTGRTHQIRVHLSESGWPLVGDATYGTPRRDACKDPEPSPVFRDFPRQALHAWRLAFAHPWTGAPVSLEAPVPADMQALMDAMPLRSAR